jgi:hypothetical protein
LSEYKTYKESYKHKSAKKVLADWLKGEYKVSVEPYMGFGNMTFRPDIATYSDGRLAAIYEVVNKNPVHGKKLGKIQYFGYLHGIEFLCHEVSADWILNQTEQPEKIEYLWSYDINFSDEPVPFD